MRHPYPGLDSASDWLKQISQVARISALLSQTTFHGETVAGVVKSRLFSQATFERGGKGK